MARGKAEHLGRSLPDSGNGFLWCLHALIAWLATLVEYPVDPGRISYPHTTRPEGSPTPCLPAPPIPPAP